MGKLENVSKSKTKRVQIEQIVLGTLMVAGVVAITMAAPNMLKLLKNADPDWISKRDPRRRLREVASRLKRKGFVEFRTQGARKTMCLTSKGEKEARRIKLGTVSIKKPIRWDGKWRIIIFDIPEKRKMLRDKIRHLVSSLGFFRLQDSVWVHPYDCEEIITLLKTDLQTGRHVLYIIADAIEFDRPIREHFGLSVD